MRLVILQAGRSALSTCRCILAAWLFAASAVAYTQPNDTTLTLTDAVARALEQHPGLQVFALQQQSLEGQRQSAALAPAWRLEAEIENFAGNGGMTGFDASEQTLALSSVIELGGKRSARLAVVDARTGRLDVERQAEALDLVSRVMQGFVDVLAAQQRLQLATEARDLAERTLQVVARRASAGGAPESEVLRAKAAQTRAELTVTEHKRTLSTQRVNLAALLGTTRPEFGAVSGELFEMPTADEFEQLYERALSNPAMARFANQQQLKEAELQLARSRGSSDIEWRLGVRRMQESGDTGLVASASLPLFTGTRSRGEVNRARAERDQVQLAREEARLQLRAQLYEAYTFRQQNIEAVQALQEQVIPSLAEALRITQRAYENGRYSYVDWMAAQHELLSAKHSLIDAAAAALTYGAVIEQFTAEPLSATGVTSTRAQEPTYRTIP